ncbi:MAG: aromatic ring-hydroxylating dioxygenase subunit alpha, partial [Salinisphaera sp.]|nr:aromatic ring-hydroxylating dioxygenase subunit alpha [Salinisphaera sp.]
MQYLKNAWYVAGLSSEVKPGELLERKLFDQNMIFYRTTAGAPVAMMDRCPHRFAPLRMGRVEGDFVVCHYHGLKFDGAGACVHNPHGDGKIPPRAVVTTYPLVERFGLVWLWPGDPALADGSALPPYEAIDEGPDTGVGYGYIKMECNYELIADNVMDLSHVDFIHGPLIYTGGHLAPQKPEFQDSGDAVCTAWQWTQEPPLGLFNDFLPEPGKPARQFVNVTWRAPCNMVVHVGATQEDDGFDQALNSIDHHMMTPESEFSTHYFMVSRRNYLVESAEYNQGKINGMMQAFLEEDAPVVAAIQQEMGGHSIDEMRPAYLAGDP